MDDLMSHTMVENLSIGIDPLTGRALSPEDCCANEVVQEALKIVLENCTIESYGSILERQRREKKEQREARKKQRAERYVNQGKTWTSLEDKQLWALRRKGYTLPHIANILKRSPSSIRTHLERQKMG